MMKKSNDTVSESGNTENVDVKSVIASSNEWVIRFTARLDDEIRLLRNDELAGLHHVSERKQQLLYDLASREKKLIKIFAQHGHLPEIKHLKEQLQMCKDRNLANQRVVMQHLNHTNKSLELLRSLLRMNDLSLYSDRGQLRVKREKRHIGSA